MGSFILGLLLQAYIPFPTKNSGGRLGFSNGVLMVASCIMLHLLVMIKLAHFCLKMAFWSTLGDIKLYN